MRGVFARGLTDPVAGPFGSLIVASATLHWIDVGGPAGRAVETNLVLAAVTALIGGIAARTVVAVVRGQLLPAPPPPAG